MKQVNINIFVVFIILLYIYQYTIKTNWIVFLTVQRGILSTSCPWWSFTDATTTDVTGVDTYNALRNTSKIVKMNIMGRTIHIVTDMGFVKQILDQSPKIFGVGSFKYDFFKSFMRLNVGVSEGVCGGCPWKRRRQFNDYILNTDGIPVHLDAYRENIKEILTNKFPTNFEEFGECGRRLSAKIVFGTFDVYKPIFEIFEKANSLSAILIGSSNIGSNLKQKYYKALNYYLDNPISGSLVEMCHTRIGNLSREEILDQIPHWIFPINGLITNGLPRLLILLLNTPRVLKHIHDPMYMRNCILEMFRLNNPVNSTFRSSVVDYSFDKKYSYPKGTQFLIINNPIMRDPRAFPNPNEFIPERWTPELENSYYSLMFNQGPQRCPGKEFVIGLLSSFTIEYLGMAGTNIQFSPKLDDRNIPQMINPCKIKFTI